MSLINSATFQNIRVIVLNAPPVNALGHALRMALDQEFDAAMQDSSIDCVVIGSILGLYSAGADIREFSNDDMWRTPSLPEICLKVDDAPKLTVAAINGAAMGGALELALACDYRVCDSDALLGLPEILLGLLPGAGGTQRLPRVAGLDNALQMILSGQPVSAGTALQMGLIDQRLDTTDATAELANQQANAPLVVQMGDQSARPMNEFLAAAAVYASDLVRNNAALRACREMTVEALPANADIASQAVEKFARKSRGQVAHPLAAGVIEKSAQLEFDAGLREERDAFETLLATPQARAMTHLFFAQREALKISGVQSDSTAREIDTVAVIGGGTMGVGIAISFLTAHIPLALIEASEGSLANAVDAIHSHYDGLVGKGRISEAAATRCKQLLTGSLDYAAVSAADLVIEAVYEDLTLKQKVFKSLAQVCKPGAILASNTSTLDVNLIAAATDRAADVVGMHFFSPANIMRLLEVVRTTDTAPEVIKSVIKLASKIGKVPVTVGVCYGFAGNRMLEPYFREASRLMLEGASAEQIDKVLTDFGMAMGVVSMGDLAGIDVGFRVREARRDELAHDAAYQAIQDTLFKLGRYGQKTGRGCYLYEGRQRSSDPEVTQLCETLAGEHGIERRDISDEEILQRCLYPLINEGLLILHEGIAQRPGDLDVIWAQGYGFPAARGGPMHYAEQIGWQKVLDGMQYYQKQLGEYGQMWFSPCGLLVELAEKQS